MLFFDALITHARSAGPGVGSVGHRQIATEELARRGRPADRHVLVHLHVDAGSRRWRRRELPRLARTRDGRLDAAGRSVSSVLTHSWGIAGGTGLYRHGHGNLLVRDLSNRESLITATINTQDGAVLHAGKLSRPPANRRFIVRANGLCQQAAQRLAALPPFPFANFDPLHPDPSLLPQVGAFFTSPGNPRPTLSTLGAGLQSASACHPPTTAPGPRPSKHATPSCRSSTSKTAPPITGDLHGFIDSVHDSAANFRQIAITATVFGTTQCVF